MVAAATEILLGGDRNHDNTKPDPARRINILSPQQQQQQQRQKQEGIALLVVFWFIVRIYEWQ